MDKFVAFLIFLKVYEVKSIACICEFIEIDYGPVVVLVEHEPDKVGADESASAGN
jgi:hypothetical protein